MVVRWIEAKWDNIRVSDEDPATYLAKADLKVLRAQWIPLDPDLWTVDRFDDFCAARRTLLAGALNEMLGLTHLTPEEEPVGGDEVPEPEVGAWGDETLEVSQSG